ncbi:MAG TPA: NADH-quinone oxidoreductase subunit N [bacterium]|nr:NADH-quinone oxidoreductase subunit N [bacterium]
MNPVYTLSDFAVLGPEIACILGAILVLSLDMVFRSQKSRRLVEAATALSLLVAGLLAWGRLSGAPSAAFGGLVLDGAIADGFRLGLAGTGLLTLVLARRQGRTQDLLHAEFYALLLFALGAMMLITVSQDLMLSFVALETFSLAMYVLAGFNKAWHGNREAAIKYFLLGAFAAAFFLLGLAFIFGAAGSVRLDAISALFHGPAMAPSRVLLLDLGVVLCVTALAFKLGAAPFHLWVPDVYSGATTPVAAFLSAGAKLAGFGALIRLLSAVPVGQAPFPQIIAVLAILTLLAGNLGALKQTNMKRLLAYSSIAHTGYALVGLLGLGVADSGADRAVLAYTLTYALMAFLAFALVAAGEERLAAQGKSRPMVLGDLQGMGFEHPFYGLAMAVAMVSMAGLPPTAGFIVKFGVFKAALNGGHRLSAAVAILNSVVSAAVYLRVLVALYMLPKTPEGEGGRLTGGLGVATVALALVLLLLGVLPVL